MSKIYIYIKSNPRYNIQNKNMYRDLKKILNTFLNLIVLFSTKNNK
jgi:hypothetical protein